MQIERQHPRIPARLNIVALALMACLLVFSHAAVWNAQFGGEDEVMQLDYATRLMRDMREGNVTDFFRAMASQSHPPLRYWLSMPGLLLVPSAEFGLRLVAILASLYMTYLVVKLGEDVGGPLVGIASGLLIAASAVFNWTSIAFGWSVIVVALLSCIRILRVTSFDVRTPEGRRNYRIINIWMIVAFLVNTGTVLFFVATCLLYFLFNWRHFLRLVLVALPFVFFYLLYYTVYLFIVPYVGAHYFGVSTAVGQFAQNMARADQTYLNVTSLLENLGGINAYLLPYFAWVVLACALYYLVRWEWVIAFWIAPFTLAWSFLLTNQSHQYFLLVFIAILPFGIKVLYDLLNRRVFIVSVAVLVVLTALWNYQVFLKPYGSDDPAYPHALIALGRAHVSRAHNITEPFAQIGDDIDALLAEDEMFIHDLAGSFTMFYYPSPHHAGQFGSELYPYNLDSAEQCYHAPAEMGNVRIIVTNKVICATDVEQEITYPNATMRLYLLKPS